MSFWKYLKNWFSIYDSVEMSDSDNDWMVKTDSGFIAGPVEKDFRLFNNKAFITVTFSQSSIHALKFPSAQSAIRYLTVLNNRLALHSRIEKFQLVSSSESSECVFKED